MAIAIRITIVANAHISPFDVTGTRHSNNTAHVTPSVSTRAAWGGRCSCPHFMHIETEAWRTYVIPPRSHNPGVWERRSRAASGLQSLPTLHPLRRNHRWSRAPVLSVDSCSLQSQSWACSLSPPNLFVFTCSLYYLQFISSFICWRIFLTYFWL